MKKILSLAVMILLTWSQSSFATDNKWFKQQQVEEPKQEEFKPKKRLHMYRIRGRSCSLSKYDN